MKTLSTLKKALTRKEGWLILLTLAVLLVFGCYEFRSINQPTEAYSNSSFDVPIVMQPDQDEENNYEGPGNQAIGIFGVLLPEGWIVEDSIAYNVVSADSTQNDDGVWVQAPEDYSNSGFIIFDEDWAAALTASPSAPPPGYYWWGGLTNAEVVLDFFDSLSYTVTILTDDQIGEFALRYSCGDVGVAAREPYDIDVISNPMPITITEATSIKPSSLIDGNIELYPNPSYGLVNLNIKDMNNQNASLLIYDMQGRTILSETLDRQDNRLDLSAYNAGAYMLRLTVGEEVVTRKFILY